MRGFVFDRRPQTAPSRVPPCAAGLLHSLVCGPLVALFLGGCTPKYDWRDVRAIDGHYTVLLPARPATLTRPVNFGGIRADMTMTAADVDDVTFAVGTALLPDAAQARAALPVMRDTLVHNIGGAMRHEKTQHDSAQSSIDADAGPAPAARGAAGSGNALVLHVRLIARGPRVYQLIVLGHEKAIQPDAVDTFLTSFKLE